MSLDLKDKYLMYTDGEETTPRIWTIHVRWGEDDLKLFRRVSKHLDKVKGKHYAFEYEGDQHRLTIDGCICIYIYISRNKANQVNYCWSHPIKVLAFSNLGPSDSGKTVLLQSMILGLYWNCFSRIYIFSPSVYVDHTRKPVIEYITQNLKQDHDKEKFFFNDDNPSELDNSVQTRHMLVNFIKENRDKTIYQTMIIIDDFADTPEVTTMVSTITTSQIYKLLSPVIRKTLQHCTYSYWETIMTWKLG